MVTADQCPRITQAFLDEELDTIGDRWFRQEYRCEFLEMEGALFGTDLVTSMFDEEAKHMFSPTFIDEEAQTFHRGER